MPGKDGTGPLGAGPMMGRGAGRCVGFNNPGHASAAQRKGQCGRGFGRHSRGGRGGRRFGWDGASFVAALGADAEKQMLTEQAQALQVQLDTIKTRLENMGAVESAK